MGSIAFSILLDFFARHADPNRASSSHVELLVSPCITFALWTKRSDLKLKNEVTGSRLFSSPIHGSSMAPQRPHHQRPLKLLNLNLSRPISSRTGFPVRNRLDFGSMYVSDHWFSKFL